VIKKGKDDRSGQGVLFCSFCGKMQSEVRKLVAGPTAYICDECIELCRYIIEEEGDKAAAKDSQGGLLQPKEIKDISGSVRYRSGQNEENSFGCRL